MPPSLEYQSETFTSHTRMSSDIVQVISSVLGGASGSESSQYSPPEGETTVAVGAAVSSTVSAASVEVISEQAPVTRTR